MAAYHAPILLLSLISGVAVSAADVPRGLGRQAAAAPTSSTPTPGVPVTTIRATAGKVDLTPNFPPVFNQGPIGSCVASALGYGLHTYQLRVANPSYPLGTTSGQFSASFLYNQYANGADFGADPAGIADIMGRRGCATLAQFAYTTNVSLWPTPAVDQQALPYRLQRVTGSGVSSTWPYYKTLPKTDLAQLKAQLAAGNPLGIGILADTAFVQMTAKQNFMWYPSGKVLGGHELAIVGYDDQVTDGAGHVGALRFQNSWGSAWGQGGRGWISYDSLAAQNVLDLGILGNVRPTATPSLTMALKVTHQRRGSIQVLIGVGSFNSPAWFDRFYTPSNNLPQTGGLDTVMDLTDAAPFWPPTTARPWWIMVTDSFKDGVGGTITGATITNSKTTQVSVPTTTLPTGLSDNGTVILPFSGVIAATKGSG